MKCSGEIIWELGAVLNDVKNAPLSYLGVYADGNCGDCKVGINTGKKMDNFLAGLFDLSFTSYITSMAVVARVGWHHCHLAVYVKPSPDGQTNIDSSVVETFSKLKWKW